MDFRFTPEEEALGEGFDDSFGEEMKNAPPEWRITLEAMCPPCHWKESGIGRHP